MAEIEVRPYRPGDEEGILASFNIVFREVCGEGFVDRDLEFWRWQFLDNPVGHRIWVAATEDGTIAAHYGGMSFPIRSVFGDCVFSQAVDSFAHPDFRRGLKKKGSFVEAGRRWFQDCEDRGDWMTYGFPVKVAERVGTRLLDYVHLCVVDYLCHPLQSATFTVPEGLAVEQVAAPSADVRGLLDRVATEKQCMTRRDAEYLEWRYVRMPGDHYEIWEARRGEELCGLMVLRPEHELVPGACTIADWLVAEADREAADALLARAAERGVAKQRKTLMTVFADWSFEHADLRRRGFEVVASAQWLERRISLRTFHPDMPSEWLRQHWWYTLGDCDLV